MTVAPAHPEHKTGALFGSSGIRQAVSRELFQTAFLTGLTLGHIQDHVVVGSDTRTSSPALKACLTAGLLAAGAQVHDAGVVPTPTLAFVGRDFGAAAMVTASHNPPEYNGIKLLNPDGSAFDGAQRRAIEAGVLSRAADIAPWHGMTESVAYHGAIERHVARIVADFPGRHRVKVVVDAGCGAAYAITPMLLSRLGCEVTTLNCHPTGFFPRGIEPTEANLAELMETTRRLGADLGLAHDGDADRLMAVDDKGRFVTGDKLLAILAHARGARQLVTTVDASMVLEENGFRVRRTRVGDIYVSEELKQGGGEFGGEPSGSWVFPAASLCPDGIYAAAELVALASRERLSALADGIRSYPLLRGHVCRDSKDMASLEQHLLALHPQAVSRVDGLKLSFSDGWLLVRPSGTEPKIRLTTEATSARRARELYTEALRLLEGENN